MSKRPGLHAKAFRWRRRYSVLLILFLTWVLSLVDRMAMSVAMPNIAHEFHFSPLEQGIVMSVFLASNTISQIPGGMLADKIGIRRTSIVAILLWSTLISVTSLASSLNQMLIIGVGFGLSEGLFAACSFKAVAVWFPKGERTTANAILLASNSLGIALAPLLFVPVITSLGWRGAFSGLVLPGVAIVVLFWFFVANDPRGDRRISAAELREIECDALDEDTPVKRTWNIRVIADRAVLSYFFLNFSFSIATWGFTAWLPTYLVEVRNFPQTQMGIIASLPFFAGTIGCILAGWASDKLFSDRPRIPVIVTQLGTALFLLLTFLSTSATAVVINQTIAGFFLCSFFSAFWAFPMKTISKAAMGTAAGFINMAGQLAGFISPILVGYVFGRSGSFDAVFALLIASLLGSCAFAFTFSRRLPVQSGVD